MNLGGMHCYGTKVGREMLRAGLQAAELTCVTKTHRIPEGKLRSHRHQTARWIELLPPWEQARLHECG